MRPERREFIRLAAGLAGACAFSRIAAALDYPVRPVRLVVTVPAGGSPDIIGRLMAQWLSDRLGQPFVVDNRPGASGNIGAELVVRSAPDGYTLLLAMSVNAINASVYRELSFNFIADVAPVAGIGTIPLVMEVNPSVPAHTVPEFIAYAKANPGKLYLAASGNGSPLHVAGELFKMMAGVDLITVPYRGEAAAMPDLLSGRVQAMFGVMPASLGYLADGRLRALAVTTPKRQAVLPELPAMAEFLPGYAAYGWYGVVAPKATPAPVIASLNDEINAALADPAMRKRLDDLGCAVFAGSADDFGAFIAAETDKWAKVVKFANIRAE
jgi:tripartite-type tricarboxylate transporter receptor subunit TctC